MCVAWRGAYLWHAVLGGTSPTPAQLRKCRVVTIRHATLWPSADVAQRPTQRDDDRRRAFLQPRRWLEPCETPYFATRGRGDMRGVPNRSCTQSHPGGGAGLCFRRGAVCIILCTTWLCGAMTACHHLRGGIFGTPFGGPRMSPTPRSAKYGVTHSDNRLPGLEITSPLVRISTMAE